MKNMEQKTKFYNRPWIIAVLTCSVFLIPIVWLIIWLTPWVWYDNSPKPLGDKLEYVGKENYGCNGLTLICAGGRAGARYYYATDMSQEEVGQYFKGADLDGGINQEGYSDDTKFRLSFTSKETVQNGFYLIFYERGDLESKAPGLPATSKKHLISLDYGVYKAAKTALNP